MDPAQVASRPSKVQLRPKSQGTGQTEAVRRRSLRLKAAEQRDKKKSRRSVPFTPEQLDDMIDLCTSTEESRPCESAAEISKSVTDSDEISSSHSDESPEPSSRSVTLGNSITPTQPHSDPSVLSPATHQSPSPTRQQMFEARTKLPLLLSTNNPAMLPSTKLSEILHLASILKTDSHLSADQRKLLKLIDEIPLAITELQENEKTAEEADTFFDKLETNIAYATTLQNEDNESKGHESLLWDELRRNSQKIKKIDDEITALKLRRAELSSVAEMKKVEVDNLIEKQKMVAESLPKVVNDIEMAEKQKPEWEMKKKISEEQKSKILSKFAVLRGFSL